MHWMVIVKCRQKEGRKEGCICSTVAASGSWKPLQMKLGLSDASASFPGRVFTCFSCRGLSAAGAENPHVPGLFTLLFFSWCKTSSQLKSHVRAELAGLFCFYFSPPPPRKPPVTMAMLPANRFAGTKSTSPLPPAPHPQPREEDFQLCRACAKGRFGQGTGGKESMIHLGCLPPPLCLLSPGPLPSWDHWVRFLSKPGRYCSPVLSLHPHPSWNLSPGLASPPRAKVCSPNLSLV